MIFICLIKVDFPASPQPRSKIFTRLFIFFFSSAISFSISLLILTRSSSDSISFCSLKQQQLTITLTRLGVSLLFLDCAITTSTCGAYEQRKQFLIKNCNLEIAAASYVATNLFVINWFYISYIKISWTFLTTQII